MVVFLHCSGSTAWLLSLVCSLRGRQHCSSRWACRRPRRGSCRSILLLVFAQTCRLLIRVGIRVCHPEGRYGRRKICFVVKAGEEEGFPPSSRPGLGTCSSSSSFTSPPLGTGSADSVDGAPPARLPVSRQELVLIPSRWAPVSLSSSQPEPKPPPSTRIPLLHSFSPPPMSTQPRRPPSRTHNPLTPSTSLTHLDLLLAGAPLKRADGIGFSDGEDSPTRPSKTGTRSERESPSLPSESDFKKSTHG